MIEWILVLAYKLRLMFRFPSRKGGGCFHGEESRPNADRGGGMVIAISSGHGARIPGAVGILNEVREARRVVKRVAKHLRDMGVTVNEFHDDDSTTVTDNISAIVNWHNSRERDMDVSVHFNAFEHTDQPRGTEVLYRTARDAAEMVSHAIAGSAGFRNRGPRFRDNLGFLNRAEKPAILLEVCFVDSATDARLYNENFDGICVAIAEALAA